MNMPEFMEYYAAGRVCALMHSHTMQYPVANKFPSYTDMVAQAQMQIPWGIAHIGEHGELDGPFYFGDQVPIAPYVGRQFRPSVHDCYTLLRDYYRQEKGVTLPHFPREGRWWEGKKNILQENFIKAGFKQIDRPMLRPDDVLLANINSPRHNNVLNHIMIVQPKGQVLHHLGDRLSRNDPINVWLGAATVCLRYVGGQ